MIFIKLFKRRIETKKNSLAQNDLKNELEIDYNLLYLLQLFHKRRPQNFFIFQVQIDLKYSLK